MTDPAPTASETRRRSDWTGENTAWWIVFGLTVLSLVAMLGLGD